MSKRRRPAASRRAAEQRFWGASYRPGSQGSTISPTEAPGVLAASLGPPPLAADPSASLRLIQAVYEEAVRAATALAAANGLLADPED